MNKIEMTKEIALELYNKLSDCKEAQETLRESFPKAFKEVHFQEEMGKLSNYEEEELKKVMEMLEGDEEIFSNINGGYAECKLVDYDEEEVQIDLEYGKQDVGDGGEDHSDQITLDRGVLANKDLSIRDKVAKTY